MWKPVVDELSYHTLSSQFWGFIRYQVIRPIADDCWDKISEQSALQISDQLINSVWGHVDE